MTVKDLIKLLSECNPEQDVVTSEYEDIRRVREETVIGINPTTSEVVKTHQTILEVAN